jgi:hypothetical protein
MSLWAGGSYQAAREIGRKICASATPLDGDLMAPILAAERFEKAREKSERERRDEDIARYKAERDRTARTCASCGATHWNNATLCTACCNKEVLGRR